MSTAVDEALRELEQRLAASSLAPALQRGHRLGPHTSYRVGGPARLFVTVEDVAQLQALAAIAAAATGLSPAPVPVLVVGRGSNLLVADRGFDGLAVALGPGLARIEIAGEMVTAGGAAMLPVVARGCVEAGLVGFEWAVGVPGTIGGAVRMNAGGHRSDMAASLVEAQVVDLRLGETTVRPEASLNLGYRVSSLADHQVVASATLRLRPGDRDAARAELSGVVGWRRANQPGGRNAGSVFTNPGAHAAGSLIESVGAKGLRIGSAEVSAKHANFIVADEDGCAADIVALMAEVRRRVKAEYAIELIAETRLVGFEPQELP